MKVIKWPIAWALIISGTNYAVPIQNVFVPREGFDSNDEVELVIQGKLPHSCLSLGQTVVQKPNPRQFRLVQRSRRRNLQSCQGGSIPQDLALGYRFERTLSLGQLKAGQYVVTFPSLSGRSGSVSFEVAPAQLNSTDDGLYAPISRIFVPELVQANQGVEVYLSGVLEASCLRMGQVDIRRLGNVIVVLPKLDRLEGNCRVTQRNLERVVSLGRLPIGRYLVHVRTLSGRSVNTTFLVAPQNEGRSPVGGPPEL